MLDITKPYPLVLVHDPALDQEKFKRNQYMDTRDPALIVEKPGQKAIRFVMRPLGKEVVDLIDVAYAGTARYNQTFKMALCAIEAGEQRLTPPTEEVQFGRNKQTMLTKEFVEQFWNQFGKESIELLGRIVFELECSARVANPFALDLSSLGGQVQKISSS